MRNRTTEEARGGQPRQVSLVEAVVCHGPRPQPSADRWNNGTSFRFCVSLFAGSTSLSPEGLHQGLA
jgi:hypothetical protein